jgi:hypothetical protein
MGRTNVALVALAAAVGLPAGFLIGNLLGAVSVAMLTTNTVLFVIHRETRNRG